MKSICIGLILAAGLLGSARSADFRTDINPALRYYQGFLLAQNVPREERDNLLNNEWRGMRLGAKFGQWVSNYDQQFRLLRAATHADVPCDWGVDLTEGPELLLGHLAGAKAAAWITRLRVMWELQNGRQSDARDDLLATLSLARNVSTDGTLISVLVQIADENILLVTVAENFYGFSTETLKEIEEGFDAAPPRGTAARSIDTGERAFAKWFLRMVKEAQMHHPGDESATIAELRERMETALGGGDNDASGAEMVGKLINSAGGTVEGLLSLINEMTPMYDRAAAILALPKEEYEAQIETFNAEIRNSSNPLINEFFPALSKVRPKEFSILGKIAMLHAAVEYKLHGEAGLNSVIDPLNGTPFTMERFVFEGEDRGFKLKSPYAGRDLPQEIIFVEKAGKPFLVDGKHVGEAAPPPTGKE